MATRAESTTTRKTRSASQRAGKPKTKIVEVPRNHLAVAEDSDLVEVPDNGAPIFSSTTDNEKENPFLEKELVFTLDDEDVFAPVRVPASWGLHFIRMRMAYGTDMAVVYALERALGPEGVDKLESIPDLDPEQLDAITMKITEKFVNALSVPKGGSKSASKS